LSAAEVINEADGTKTAVVKVRSIGLSKPKTVGGGESQGPFANVGSIPPPYDMAVLFRWVEDSHTLRPNIDAYANNIDGFGHRLEPAIDLRAEGAKDEVAEAVFANLLLTSGIEPAFPEGDALDAEVEAIRRKARIEKARAEAFFANCAYEPGQSFAGLRRETRRHLEGTGNAFWEVLRNRRGEPSRFKLVPPHLCQLMPLDDDFTMVDDWERTSQIHVTKTSLPKRCRRVVYIEDGTTEEVYLKEFGDPRVMSPRTGRYYFSPEDLARDEEGVQPANEYVHFKIEAPDTPYGVPRWIGALPDVMGLYKAAKVNLLFFDNKSIPPMALLVSGGTLADGGEERIKKHIEENIKGVDNFHKILVIEAESDGKSGTAMRVELKPLTDAIQKDALFLNYDERGTDKAGGQFRLPRLMRGDTRDFNRATADAAIRLSEDQVFAPERDDFDFYINRRVMPSIGCSFYIFRSLTPVTRDPERLSKVVKEQVVAGTITPRDGRAIIEDAFNRRLPPINRPWMDQPIALTLAGIQNDMAPGAGDSDEVDVDQEARRMLEVKSRLDRAKAQLADRRMALARQQQLGGDLDEITLQVPAGEFRSWFKPTGEGAGE